MEPKATKWYESQVLWLVVGGVLFVALVGFGVWRYVTVTQELNKLKTNANQITADDQKKLLDEVSKVILLPEGESPTIALVTDVEQLKNQQFFVNAKNGDRVIIYPNAKKAILYRPSDKRVIDVAPVNLNASDSAQATENSPVISPKPVVKGESTAVPNLPTGTVELRNGTLTQGLTQKYEPELKQKAPSLTISARGNAKKTDYAKSMLIDTSGTRLAEAKVLASSLGIPVGVLPEGEIPATTDYLILLGNDKVAN